MRERIRGWFRAFREYVKEQQRINRLHTMPYQEYLRTDHWKKLRYEIKRRDKFACTKCGCKQSLEVHHHTYARRGYERMEDLTTLCAGCHDIVHDEIRMNRREVA
jgi:5-methylcytosine-specific restriction endonuclease McrA